MITKVKLKRVCYGKASTPENLREYTIVGSGSSAVGTKEEIKLFFATSGIDVEFEVVK